MRRQDPKREDEDELVAVCCRVEPPQLLVRVEVECVVTVDMGAIANSGDVWRGAAAVY